MGDYFHEIDFDEVKHETDNAWLLDLGDQDIWLPKSRCTLYENEGFIAVPDWLAEQKGLA